MREVSAISRIFIDLLLWVYVLIPNYENSSSADPSKLIFRGHKDCNWSLTPTASRNLKTDGDRQENRLRIERFIRRIRAEFPEKLLETEIEQEVVAQHYGRESESSTTLLDFTTDVDVAAYFATQPTAAKYGTIFMCDTRIFCCSAWGTVIFSNSTPAMTIFSRRN
jgi:hypothetical protein